MYTLRARYVVVSRVSRTHLTRERIYMYPTISHKPVHLTILA
jgi:hypothetical protein